MTKYANVSLIDTPLNEKKEKTIDLTGCWIGTFLISLLLVAVVAATYFLSQLTGAAFSRVLGLDEICNTEDDNASFFTMCPLIGFSILLTALIVIVISLTIGCLSIYVTKQIVKYLFKRCLHVNIVCCADPISHVESPEHLEDVVDVNIDIEMKKSPEDNNEKINY